MAAIQRRDLEEQWRLHFFAADVSLGRVGCHPRILLVGVQLRTRFNSRRLNIIRIKRRAEDVRESA